MTLDQVVQELATIDPTRNYCAAKDRWYHPASHESSQHCVSHYRLSILPGVDGSPCTQFYGATLEEVMEKARLAISAKDYTDTNEE